MIRGCKHPFVQDTLLCKESSLTLDEALTTARIFEAKAQQVKSLHASPTSNTQTSSSVCAVKRYQPSRHTFVNQQQPYNNHSATSGNTTCYNCGTSHRHDACPAYDSICRTCGKRGHWSIRCRSGTRSAKPWNRPQRPTLDRREVHASSAHPTLLSESPARIKHQ